MLGDNTFVREVVLIENGQMPGPAGPIKDYEEDEYDNVVGLSLYNPM